MTRVETSDSSRVSAACAGCGCPAGDASLAGAALLHNVGWRAGIDGRPRCPVCIEHGDGERRRFVRGSSGAMYALVREATAWRCSCRGYLRWKHCKHVDALAERRAA